MFHPYHSLLKLCTPAHPPLQISAPAHTRLLHIPCINNSETQKACRERGAAAAARRFAPPAKALRQGRTTRRGQARHRRNVRNSNSCICDSACIVTAWLRFMVLSSSHPICGALSFLEFRQNIQFSALQKGSSNTNRHGFEYDVFLPQLCGTSVRVRSFTQISIGHCDVLIATVTLLQ